MNHRIKIFVKYLLRRPFEALYDIFKLFKTAIMHINSPVNWFWASAFLTIYFIYVKANVMIMFASVMFLAYIIVLWRQGDWMKEHRENRGYKLQGGKRK